MKKVKYIGRTSDYLTKDKVYDVTQYITDTNSIIVRNDVGIYDKYFLNNPIANISFEDVSVQYRNDVIAEILS